MVQSGSALMADAIERSIVSYDALSTVKAVGRVSSHPTVTSPLRERMYPSSTPASGKTDSSSAILLLISMIR